MLHRPLQGSAKHASHFATRFPFPMRILTRTLALVLICTLLFAGCDSLNLQPRDELASQQIWQDSTLTKAYLNQVYSNIGHGFGAPKKSSIANETVFTHGWGVTAVNNATMTPGSRGLFGGASVGRGPFVRHHWGRAYSNIRDLNIFLREIGESDALGSSTKETLRGEAHFLRAFFYASLMRPYGGIPLLANVFELQGDLTEYQIPRNTFKETVDFIIADLDSAATRLPRVGGRRPATPTKGAALALKCRVRLHAASDLFAENPSGMEVTGYTGGSQRDRWQTAKETCRAVVDMNEYSLEQANTPRAYHELFTGGNESGTIWARYFSQEGGGVRYEMFQSPNGYHGWTSDTPTQEHVDAYEMADGSQFEWEGADPVSSDEPVDAEDPYNDRDPRFKANIFYNGADWRARPSDMQNLDPKGVIQMGWYEMPDREGPRAGIDTREGPVQGWNGTKTGYGMKKFVDRDVLPRSRDAFNPWPFLRYAEVLLNYAEAAANLGDTPDALRALNKVRNRVGMPDVPPDGGPGRTLMERIRQERRVELAFEGQRYFDLRRWMSTEALREDSRGIRVEGRLVDESHPDAEQLVENYYDYEYKVIHVLDRQWDDRLYFVPIPAGEMRRNPELAQNPGY